ncbi:glycosyltransferase [Candidatus Woesearchaeota archaeon]|nr:glycosyltransferase [Candidatus Woesearchaeota archaeon]
MAPRISIIVPTLDEEEYLPKLLESVRHQTFRDYEIIVADAGSSDQTRAIARAYGAKVVDGGMPGAGRNAGARAARGELLFFFDADVKIPKEFLRKAYDEMQERFLDFATCEFRPLSTHVLDRFICNLFNANIKMMQYSDPHAMGFAIFVTRRLFERVGGFDETIRVSEDHDFARRASVYRPVRVLHSTTLSVSVRRHMKEGRLAYLNKSLRIVLFRFFRGELRDDIIEYEFGYGKRKPIDDKLRRMERQLESMNRKYNHWAKRHLKGDGLRIEEGLRKFYGQLDALNRRFVGFVTAKRGRPPSQDQKAKASRTRAS